ncbi:lipase [Elysia marginata]|uniref:Lipase n=1 Tax=Elysia marginata TaxID=1093978 RepID=A0AAV4IN29_9GAST|nr:lipase [Elysia marginata]
MAKYDLPVMVRYVVQQTGGSKIYYVGHSQGSGIGFIQMARDPGLAQLIHRHFALVPATRVNDTDGLGKTISKIGDLFYFFFYVVHRGPTTYAVPEIPPFLCQWIGYELCRDLLFSLTGGNKASFNVVRPIE